MASEESTITITVIALGQVAEQLGGRQHERTVGKGHTVRELVLGLGLEAWISFGLSVAFNGERCSMDTPLTEGGEIALLPPVSGG